ncbi:phosphotransferase [Microlunatus elymi]|uniref:Phosphotransferase n=1 Tax=Microlunatus elymi TaxID=2596828 RepID=A0A516PWC3_9ACTN|nr:phosphotransferase [Microlunatus elymi]QDP95442.1 phosphotransferase [Microlunatus elymi]
MESITKNRQSQDTLLAMVERAYGPVLRPVGDDWVQELGHGWFNVAYRIRLGDGSQVVLKIAPPPDVEVMTYERGAMAVELASLQLISEHTSVPVPSVDCADASHELCDADYFFMPYIDADNFGILEPTLGRGVVESCHEAIGAANRELNSNQDCLDEVTEPRFVEWDLWDSNVMVRDGRIVSIIDHERAFWGDPLMEAGFTAIDLPHFGDPSAFIRGYGQTELTATQARRRRLYTLYLGLIMIIETDYRGHTDNRQYDSARQRLTEMMALFGNDAR